MVPVSFAQDEFALTSANALYWPKEQALLVADLHLEKASFYAGHGQMLPPYDSRETLDRLARAIRETGARRVFTLGDNFHDDGGARRLEPYAAGMLRALTLSTDWIWITGNHDSELTEGDKLGGAVVDSLETGGIHLRHQAQEGEKRPEISGHYHPRLHVTLRNRPVRKPCLVHGSGSAERLILPAFGALTGGMNAADPAIVQAMQPADTIMAMLHAKGKLLHFPLWKRAT
ncbi:ligase-associated DNA damage response endonuclease PdeM [Altericroceibacterium endophyticum]|uniref:Ligase-associated DNA damage response endonuclease PdeM n=1 Tax=Altericroceibacterium endophyticum TaxID=1808508 RepID=A0A6I4T8D1_9SPHN|nr:ligase-associated DNA damage response endonuclease PdeM [Altericroceibacterium endophyticum]MXO66938.1 ligase-associated DNA damage response endonuclease PdeM [Altericroceibacterium endophyticum]